MVSTAKTIALLTTNRNVIILGMSSRAEKIMKLLKNSINKTKKSTLSTATVNEVYYSPDKFSGSKVEISSTKSIDEVC